MISSDAPQTPLLQAMKLLQLLFVYAKVGTLVSAIYEMVVAIGQARPRPPSPALAHPAPI